jgi:hypothetical protein
MKELKIFRKFLNEDREIFDYDKLTRKQIEKLEDLKAEKEKKSKFKKAGEKAGFDMRGLKENISDQEYFSYLDYLRDSGKTNMFGAGAYLQKDFGLDKREAREILVKWMRSFDEDKSLHEWVGKELEDRNEKFFDLVPGAGSADTIEGEMLRAINRIVYRYYNDGDEYMRGYGTETAGPAHSFLINSNNPLQQELTIIFRRGTDYEETIKLALTTILDYIESRNNDYTKNTLGDMLDYEPEFEDEESYEDDWDDDDYYDDDDY